MVGGGQILLLLSPLSVNHYIIETIADTFRAQQKIDPEAMPAMKGPPPVVPPREGTLVRIFVPKKIM
jgi:hypothetical protein